jgi:putative flippase GtrA
VYAVPITLNFVAFPLFIEVVKMNAYLAQAIITAVTTVIGYFGHKHISFAKPRTDPKKDE